MVISPRLEIAKLRGGGRVLSVLDSTEPAGSRNLPSGGENGGGESNGSPGPSWLKYVSPHYALGEIFSEPALEAGERVGEDVREDPAKYASLISPHVAFAKYVGQPAYESGVDAGRDIREQVIEYDFSGLGAIEGLLRKLVLAVGGVAGVVLLLAVVYVLGQLFEINLGGGS